MEQIVIVGAGQGGLQAAISLRQEGFNGHITLIGDEPSRPYQRPPLSKAYLKSGEEDRLYLRNAEFFEQNDITLIVDCRIERLDPDRQLLFAKDRSFAYDHLILATGCRNAKPPIEGLDRCLDLRTLDDARRLRSKVADAKRSAVIGGGFIGLEFAAVARGLDLEVAIADMAGRLMARAVSPTMSKRFLTKHEGMGVTVHLGCFVQEVTEDGLILADGRVLPADLTVVAAGVVPNISLAQQAGLAIDNGIAVNHQLTTSDPNISALGDCASFPNPVNGQQIRLESVQAATDHARHIAKKLMRRTKVAYASVPWFWSDQADWKLQIAGLASPDDDSVELPDGSVLRFADDCLTAVETINSAKVHMKARKALSENPEITRQDATAMLQ